MNVRCRCWKPLSPKAASIALLDELEEFIMQPSSDELDDVKVCANRLLGSLVNRASVSLFSTPLYDRKVNARMQHYGCIRSRRHLVNGACPSTA